jgi:hypothetical protein
MLVTFTRLVAFSERSRAILPPNVYLDFTPWIPTCAGRHLFAVGLRRAGYHVELDRFVP